jgi:DNA-binding NarL/FixJ family response regulator
MALESIPSEIENGATHMHDPIPPQMDTRSLRILIVDDIAQVRQNLQTLLPLAGRKAGVSIDVIGDAANGEEAVQHASSLRPEVVIMDLAMPVLDGYEAARQIKKLIPSCRVVALTIHDYETARLKAIQSGVDGFVVKGSPIEMLLQAITGNMVTSK